MGDFLEELNPMVKGVFAILISVMLASLLYIVLISGDNSALRVACRAIERPISEYYYSFALSPSIHVNAVLGMDLGIDTKSHISDLSVEDADNASAVSDYSTGWK